MFEWFNEDLFIVSDTHFSHKNILKYEPVRLSVLDTVNSDNDIANVDIKFIELWNSVVSPKDHVLHLGDFVFGNSLNFNNISKLNGVIHLVPGNHDYTKLAKYRSLGIDVLEHVIIFTYSGFILHKSLTNNINGIICNVNNKRIMFSHYPVVENDIHNNRDLSITKELYDLFVSNECDLNIHGHIHSKVINDYRLVNVCVEHINFKPIKLGELIKCI